ncbi:hypothetical protein [Chondrinema litorale]|uniref:hypothetical protein n=1 Tax=Chondrinema litorale TaxID=2994555 RepID=UPI00254274E3|nr:hypothetical protein [Chondrinema litorale]UZR92360.1 hypothetical protein OQ292_10860 [Chondrinema litorale]
MLKFWTLLLTITLLAQISLAQDTQKKIPEQGKYDGKFRKGQRHGRGTCIWPDGSKYTGMWKYGTMNGKGIFTYQGYKYDGYWENGEKSGRGTLTFPDGTYYTGEFKNDKYHGFGILKLSDGSSHEGHFKNSKSNGQGKHVWASGTQYIGEWKDDMMNGKGILMYYDGKVEQGTFKNNEYVPCDCKELEQTPIEAYNSSEAVFVGKVTSVYPSENGDFEEVFFEIEQHWKGEFGFGRTVVVATAYTSCDMMFFEGESYLVYASSEVSGYFITSKCTRTQEALFATYDIEQLNAELPCEQEQQKVKIFNSSETDFVCGCNGKTYKNPYKAAEDGVSNWKKGKCPENGK